MKKIKDWISLFWLFFSTMIKSPFISGYYLLIGNNEKALFWYKEMFEAYYWCKIHIKYKSKRIK